MQPEDIGRNDFWNMPDSVRKAAIKGKTAADLVALATAFGIAPGDEYYDEEVLVACYNTIFPHCATPNRKTELGYRNRLQAEDLLKAAWYIYDAAMSMAYNHVKYYEQWETIREVVEETDFSPIGFDLLTKDIDNDDDLAAMCEECADYYNVPEQSRPVIADLTRRVVHAYSFQYFSTVSHCAFSYASVLTVLAIGIENQAQRRDDETRAG